MDPQELAALLGFSENPPMTGEAGVSSEVPLSPVGAQNPNYMQEAPANQGYDTAAQDFAPQSYDFGNHAAKPMEYDQQGNLYEVLPNKVKIKVKQGESGYSAEKMDQIERGPMGSKKALKGEDALYEKEASRYAGINQSLGQLEQGQQAAQDQIGQAEAQKITAMAGHNLKLQGIREQHAREFEALNHSTLVAKQQAKNAYQAKLMEIPEVNPNALWDEAGSSGQFQMAVAAFVHNMLGVKGIKTTAMDTINQAIDNKIKAQVHNIQTKKDVAAGFKDLYEMTVQESASQAEVQAKLQGYYLKAFEAGVDADMGKYDSNLARAKNGMLKMEFRKALIDNQVKVHGFIDKNFTESAQREVTRRGQNMTAAIAKANRENELAVAQERTKAEKEKNAKARVYVFDSETGKGKFVFKEGIKDEVVMKKLEEAGKFDAANQTMTEIRALERKMKPVLDPLTGTRFAPEDAQRYNALVTNLAHELVAARGERPTDKDVEQQLKSLPTNTTLRNGGVDKILADTQRGLSRAYDAQLRQFVDDVPEAEQPQGKVGRLAEGSYIDAQNTSAGPGPESRASELGKVARSPDSWKPTSEDKNISETVEYKQFTQPYWEDFRRARPDIDFTYGRTGEKPKSQPPLAFHAVRELAEEAFNGDKQAREDLTVMADPIKTDDAGENAIELRAMAKYFLEKLDKPKAPHGAEGTRGFGIETDKGPVMPEQVSDGPDAVTWDAVKAYTDKTYGKWD